MCLVDPEEVMPQGLAAYCVAYRQHGMCVRISQRSIVVAASYVGALIDKKNSLADRS